MSPCQTTLLNAGGAEQGLVGGLLYGLLMGYSILCYWQPNRTCQLEYMVLSVAQGGLLHAVSANEIPRPCKSPPQTQYNVLTLEGTLKETAESSTQEFRISFRG